MTDTPNAFYYEPPIDHCRHCGAELADDDEDTAHDEDCGWWIPDDYEDWKARAFGGPR